MEIRREQKMVPREGPYLSTPFREFDRIFEEFRTGLEDVFWKPTFFPLTTSWTGGPRHTLVDIKDQGSEFVVVAELPGVKKEDLDIEVSGEAVEVKAKAKEEKEVEEEDYYHRERTHGSWYRRVLLPTEILPEKAEAELREGLLEVHLPKKEPQAEKKTRKIRVK